jgi:hypothetical protein
VTAEVYSVPAASATRAKFTWKAAPTASTEPRPKTATRLASVRVTSRPWSVSHCTSRSWSVASGKYLASISDGPICSPRATRACSSSKLRMRSATSNVMLAALSSARRVSRETEAACFPPVGAAGTSLMLPGKAVRAGAAGAACRTGPARANTSRRRRKALGPLMSYAWDMRPP